MRRRTIGTAGMALAAVGATMGPALAAPPSSPTPGNGAQHSGLSATSGSTTSQCVQGSGAGTNGWSMLNRTGSPANTSATLLQGEVHLINATPNSTYTIELAGPNNSNCTPVGALSTNVDGIGNGHIPSMPDMSQVTGTSGTYYVVLTDSMMKERFASGPLTVN